MTKRQAAARVGVLVLVLSAAAAGADAQSAPQHPVAQTGGWAVLNVELANTLGRAWEDGWNRRDLDTIMAPFAAEVVFSSPAVPRGTGNPVQTTIRGYDALRKYIGDSLRGPGQARYTLDNLYVGTDSVVLHYSCLDVSGKRTCTGADIMRVNDAGKIVEWRCHYTVGSGPTDLIKVAR